MVLKINKYKFEKVLQEGVELKVPEDVIYLFEYHVRRSIKIIPIWTTWNKEQYNKEEEIWRFEFVLVYGSFQKKKIERVGFAVSEIENILMRKTGTLEEELLEIMTTYDSENIRTKEQFESDFKTIIESFKE